jgi:hypothetical protein
MLAATETTAASDMGCKRRCSPAMAEEKPSGEAAEEALQGKKAGLLVLQRKKMYVAVVPLKKGGCEKVASCEKSRLIIFRVLQL